MAEIAGILMGMRMKVLKVLKNKGAIDEKTAVNPEEAEINFKRVLEFLEKSGRIGRTSDGKIYLIEKGR
jgi:hypothetical protein